MKSNDFASSELKDLWDALTIAEFMYKNTSPITAARMHKLAESVRDMIVAEDTVSLPNWS